MEKVIYLIWRKPEAELPALAASLPTVGVRGLRLNLADEAVKPAVGLRQACLKPAPDALVQVWVDSAIRHLRAPVDDAVAACAARYAAYLVTESQPLVNTKHAPQPGQRTEGFAQIALLRRPATLTQDAWLNVWHNSHTKVAVETQSTFEYIQNVVVRALTPDAPAIDAIVEECFPVGAMTDYKVFFDAPGDETKFKQNLQRMMQSVARFIEPGQIDVIPTSQYQLQRPAD